VSGSTTLARLTGEPQFPFGRRNLVVSRFHTRANGWDASPSTGPQFRVQRLGVVAKQGRFRLEYEITKESVLGPVG